MIAEVRSKSYNVYTTHTLFVKYLCDHHRSFCFLALLKKCENVVHYNNQAAAAVDYIMFNFDNFSISILYGQVLLKKAAMYVVKKSSFCSGTDQRNKYICLVVSLASHITKICIYFLGKKTNVNFL
jgi:hypothetical protein